jgi:transposase
LDLTGSRRRSGRPSYHPSILLKIYVYGYINRIASSRRLEREAGRNVELMWLTGRLAPDFKTIADFRKDNGAAIRATCRRFVEMCRRLNLFAHAVAAIDGSKFKAVNARDKNFTRAKLRKRMEQVEASIERYLSALETADRQEGELAEAKSARLKDKIASLRDQMRKFKALEVAVDAAPDKQISLTDPDARSMATSGKGTGVVGYNVQTAVDTKHHLIVAHEVTNVGSDRGQLSTMARETQAAIGASDLTAIADRGYFKGEEILACEAAGVTPLVPKPLTSGAKADGRFGKQDFIYDPQEDAYRCPAGETLTHSIHNGGGGAHAARLLDGQMRRLRSETPMHACQGTARQALGARSRPRCDAGKAGPCARDHAHPSPDRRAPVRDHQSLDGRDPLSDAHPRKSENRDEPSRSRLQSQAGDRHPRGAADDPGGKGGLKGLRIRTHFASQTASPLFAQLPLPRRTAFLHALGRQ